MVHQTCLTLHVNLYHSISPRFRGVMLPIMWSIRHRKRNSIQSNGLSESMKRDPNMKQIPLPLSESEFVELIQNVPFISVIGHQDLADALTMITDREILYNRRAIQLNYDDCILLVSLNGRLPEHPTYVEYKGRLNYAFIRFEKQSEMDLQNTKTKIREIKEAC